MSDDEARLQRMIDWNKQDDELIAECIQTAEERMQDYQLFKGSPGAERLLIQAEGWAAIARAIKQDKFSIAEVRKQREQIQWRKRQASKTQPSTELTPSSSPSRT